MHLKPFIAMLEFHTLMCAAHEVLRKRAGRFRALPFFYLQEANPT